MRKNNNKNQEIGRISIGFRPYQIDLKHIDTITKTEFNNNQSDAVRQLIREALERRRLVGSGRDATMTIVRSAQKEVINSQLTPLIRQIDALGEQVKSLEEKQGQLSSGIANSTAKITGEIHASRELAGESGNRENGNELLRSIHGMLRQVTQDLKPIATNNETTLKNVMMLRGLFYFFLVAYQSGSIIEGDKLERWQWVYFVRTVSERIGELAVDEYKNLDAGGQNKYVENYAKKLFEEVRIIKSMP